MIAERAGISRRTFFNHYQNKQDAIVGPKVDRFGQAYDWFVTSDGGLLSDLQILVRQVVAEASPDPSVIRNIGKVLGDSPDLQPVFSATIANLTRELEPLLSRRLGTEREPVAHLIAHLVSQAIAHSFRDWTVDNETALEQVVEKANSNIRFVVQTLGPG
ncbi:TetR/AcrR family transcriptional regulator [Tranquillimonas rosea]